MVNPQPRTWMDMQKPRDFQFFILKEYIHHSVSRHLAPYFVETLSYKIEPPAYVAYVQFLPQCRYAAYAFFSNPCELQDLEFPFPLLGGDLRHVRLLHVGDGQIRDDRWEILGWDDRCPGQISGDA